jgi:hypothetical protein
MVTQHVEQTRAELRAAYGQCHRVRERSWSPPADKQAALHPEDRDGARAADARALEPQALTPEQQRLQGDLIVWTERSAGVLREAGQAAR